MVEGINVRVIELDDVLFGITLRIATEVGKGSIATDR
jgi:hypothetical protein